MINMLFSQYNFHESWAKKIVAKYINPHDKVLIIPFSFGDYLINEYDWKNAYSKNSGKFYESIVTPFKNYSIQEDNIQWVNYFKDTLKEATDKVRNSQIIFFTGGFPDKMVKRLDKFDLIEVVSGFSGVIIGSNAGAMIQIAEYHITPDEDYRIFSYNKGLNLINGIDIEVHYVGTEMQNYYINKVLDEKVDKVYALSDSGGITVNQQKVLLLGDTKIFSEK